MTGLCWQDSVHNELKHQFMYLFIRLNSTSFVIKCKICLWKHNLHRISLFVNLDACVSVPLDVKNDAILLPFTLERELWCFDSQFTVTHLEFLDFPQSSQCFHFLIAKTLPRCTFLELPWTWAFHNGSLVQVSKAFFWST
jgi:hypothetical protein